MKLLHHDTEYPEPFCTCVVFMEKYADVAYNAGTPASATHLAAIASEHSSSILGMGLLPRSPFTYLESPTPGLRWSFEKALFRVDEVIPRLEDPEHPILIRIS